MKNLVAIGLVAVLAAGLAGCGGCGGKPKYDPARDVKYFLAEQGIDTQSLRVIGRDAFITYEASEALAYDHQLLAVWGMILGALSELAPDTVTIVNTAGGKPAVVVKARTDDIRAFKQGKLSHEGFMKKVQISYVGD